MKEAKQYFKKVIPLHLSIILLGVVIDNIHEIVNCITNWYVGITDGLSNILKIGIIVIIYIIITVLQLSILDSSIRKRG